MALDRRAWRFTVTMDDDDDSVVLSVEVIGYLKPQRDADNPDRAVKEEQEGVSLLYGDLTTAQKSAADAFVTSMKTARNSKSPINPGP